MGTRDRYDREEKWKRKAWGTTRRFLTLTLLLAGCRKQKQEAESSPLVPDGCIYGKGRADWSALW